MKPETAMAAQILEGTWDEIAVHAQDLRGYPKLQLIIPEANGQPAINPFRADLSAAERIRLMDAFAESNRDLPNLPDEAFDREVCTAKSELFFLMAYLTDTNVMWRRFDPSDARHSEVKSAIDSLLLAGETIHVTAQKPDRISGLGHAADRGQWPWPQSP